MDLDYVKSELTKVFDQLGDFDLFNNINHLNIGENYVCYKIHGEYGISISICDLSGNEHFRFFLDDNKTCISTFYNNSTKKGIYEKIYSNRTEYFIDNKYCKTYLNDKLEKIIQNNTKLILVDKIYPTLYDFIMCNDNITLISIKEFAIVNANEVLNK